MLKNNLFFTYSSLLLRIYSETTIKSSTVSFFNLLRFFVIMAKELKIENFLSISEELAGITSIFLGILDNKGNSFLLLNQ